MVAFGGPVSSSGGQADPATEGPEPTPRFGAGTEVVLLDVVVRDKKGETVRDLREGEIEVYEDGVRQRLVSFALRATGEEPRDEEGPGVSARPGVPLAAKRPRDEGTVHANLVTLVFDQLGPDGRQIARRAGLALAELGEGPDLLVSVFHIRESLRLVQQFTSDREDVERAVLEATGEVNTQYTDATGQLDEAVGVEQEARQRLDSLGAVNTPGEAMAAARLGQDVNIARMAVDALRFTQALQREQQGHSSLYSLLALSKQQQQLAGRKTILFFSEGLQVPPQLEHVLRTAISEANRANVAIYAVDTRGLTEERALESTRQTLQQAALASQRQVRSRAFEPVTREEILAMETAESALRMDAQGALADLAAGTGGRLIANTNDLRRGIERAVGDLRGYYEMAYAPSNLDYDGQFRRIEVKVSRPDVIVQARSGYFALPPGEGTATFPYEVDLLRALRVRPEPNGFSVRTRLFRFGPEPGGMRHTLVLEVPLAGIRFQPDDRGDTDRAHFSILAVLRDATGRVVEKFSEDTPVFLPRYQRSALKRGNIVFVRSFAAPPGRYSLEAAVTDQLADGYSVRRRVLTVAEPASGLAMSEIAFVRRTETVPEGVLSTEDPFRQGGSRIVPFTSEPRVNPGDDLSLFLVAYPTSPVGRPDLLVEFLRDGRVVDQSLTELSPPGESGRIPYRTTIPMTGWTPGRYEVRALLKQGGLVAHQRAHFVLDEAGGVGARARSGAPAPVGGPREEQR
jgi:VWFA-related protein